MLYNRMGLFDYKFWRLKNLRLSGEFFHFDGQLDRIWSCLGDQSLRMSVREFLDWVH